MTSLFLLVGLGNPGQKYAHNRHNIGAITLDELARRYYAPGWVKKFNGLWTEEKSTAFKIHFLKPQTYMNLSGESVAACARFYKIAPEHIIVLHDELDLPTGKLKVKQGGGDGGHNGLKSIDAHLGSNYWRVRIGIGHPGNKALVSSYVLSNFSKDEWNLQEKIIAAIAEHFSLLFLNNAAGFMNKIAHSMSSVLKSSSN